MPGPSHSILPKITPVSVEETYMRVNSGRRREREHGLELTLMVALILWKLCGAIVYVDGRSTSFKSPRVAKSKQRFCSVFGVWLTRSTSADYHKALVYSYRLGQAQT